MSNLTVRSFYLKKAIFKILRLILFILSYSIIVIICYINAACMDKKISLKDIAKKVGVSTALVSYVLNNQKEGRIKKEVAQKIRDTAKALNYRTNQIARSLKMSKTFTVGLIVSNISNPFSSGLARIIEDEADKQNYTVIFGSSDEKAAKFSKLVDTFLTRQVDGLIIAPPVGADDQIKYIQQQEVPFVLIDRVFPGIPTSYAALDNCEAAYRATEYIIKGGARRPAMLNYETGLFHLQERTRGYQKALHDNQIPFEEDRLKLVDISNIKTQIEQAIQELLSLSEPADAILFGSNSITNYAVKYINTLPLKVPDDLALISFDETEALDLFYAPITCIKQPLQEMGKQAIHILLDHIHKKNEDLQQISLKAELIKRASTKEVEMSEVASEPLENEI